MLQNTTTGNLEKKLGFFFADAEKAIDSLNWDFLFLTMEKLELGQGFCNAVKAIFQNQDAAIRINNDYIGFEYKLRAFADDMFIIEYPIIGVRICSS